MDRHINTVPHQFYWMGAMYKRLISLPNYPNLSKEERVAALLEMYDEWESDPDFPRQKRIPGTHEEKLKTMERVILRFESEPPNVIYSRAK